MATVWGSSMNDPRYANYKGSQTYNFVPVASRGGVPVNAQGLPQIGGSSSTSGTGGTGGTGGSSGGSSGGGSGPDPFMAAIEEAFGARMGYLNQAADRINSQLPEVLSDMDKEVAATRTSMETEKAASERDLTRQYGEGEARKEDAWNAARRLYNELVTGGQQRFGGASSAGEAYQALSGRELQRNRADVQKEFEMFTQQIEGARTNLNERWRSSVQALETKVLTAKNDVRRNFQNQLLEIDRLKAGAVEDKANAKLQALQDMRNQIFQIDLAKAEGQKSIDVLKQQAESELNTAMQSFGQSVQLGETAQSNLQSAVPTSYNTNLTLGTTPQANQSSMMTGVKDDEYMTGYANPQQNYEDLMKRYSSFA